MVPTAQLKNTPQHYAVVRATLSTDRCPYLSRVEGADVGVLHEEHVDEVDEDAGSQAGVRGPEGQPLVEDHEHQVAKETQQEEQLREEHQEHVVALPEVSAGRTQELEEIHMR